jgi:SAM-dependent methyltransferase
VSEPPLDPGVNARLTGYTRAGFAARYHAYRPRPPEVITAILTQLAQTGRPRLVVDLGSGTGLSTFLWAERAETVIGVEPLDEMRHIAEASNRAPHVRFVAGVAQRTGLPAGAADIVTCGQSLHDMEPEGTLAGIARILRPGGVFSAYDYDWPPVVHPQAEEAFFRFMDRVEDFRERHAIRRETQQWDKARHLTRLRNCGHFRHLREMLVHQSEPCSAERWVGFALTLSHVLPVLDLGPGDQDLGLTTLRAVADRSTGLPWYVSYRVRIAVR